MPFGVILRCHGLGVTMLANKEEKTCRVGDLPGQMRKSLWSGSCKDVETKERMTLSGYFTLNKFRFIWAFNLLWHNEIGM